MTSTLPYIPIKPDPQQAWYKQRKALDRAIPRVESKDDTFLPWWSVGLGHAPGYLQNAAGDFIKSIGAPIIYGIENVTGYKQTYKDDVPSAVMSTNGTRNSEREYSKFTMPPKRKGMAKSKTTGRMLPINRRRIIESNNARAAGFRAAVRALNARRSRGGMRGRGRGRGRGRNNNLSRIGPAAPKGIARSARQEVPFMIATSQSLGTRLSQFSKGPNGTFVPATCFDEVVNALYLTANSSANFIVMGGDITSCNNDYYIAPRATFYSPLPLVNVCANWAEFEIIDYRLEFSPVFGTQHSGELIIASMRDVVNASNQGLNFYPNLSDDSVTPVLNPRTQYYSGDDGKGAPTFMTATAISDYNGLLAPYTSDVKNSFWGTGQSVYTDIRNWTAARPKLTQPFTKWNRRLLGAKGWKRNYLVRDHFTGNTPDTQPGNNAFNGPVNPSIFGDDTTETAKYIAGAFYLWGTLSDNYQATVAPQFRKVGDLTLHFKIRFRNFMSGVKDNDMTVGNEPSLKQRGFSKMPHGMMEKMAHDPQFIAALSKRLKDMNIVHGSRERKSVHLPNEMKSESKSRFVGVQSPVYDILTSRSRVKKSSTTKSDPGVSDNMGVLSDSEE
jgi:hypothetical protein